MRIMLFAFLIFLAAPAVAQTNRDSGLNDPDFAAFVEMLKAANLYEAVTSGSAYTLFAPTNAAFDDIVGAEREDLLDPEKRDNLRKMMAYHIAPGTITTKQLDVGKSRVPTYEGAELTLNVGANSIYVEEAEIIERDLHDGPLTIQKIDAVLSDAPQ